jgi:hypothetical protein
MATTHYSFTLLTGADTAGYNSINTLITSIDTSLYTRVAVPGMIMLNATATIPTGWAALTSLTSPTLSDMNTAFGTPPGTVTWIKKSA